MAEYLSHANPPVTLQLTSTHYSDVRHEIGYAATNLSVRLLLNSYFSKYSKDECLISRQNLIVGRLTMHRMFIFRNIKQHTIKHNLPHIC